MAGNPFPVPRHSGDVVAFGTVVREEHNDRVPHLAALSERREHAPDLRVEIRDHRRVQFHTPRFAPLRIRGEVFPIAERFGQRLNVTVGHQA